MLIFTLRRLNLFLFTLVLLTVLSFSLSFLSPGDQITNISGQINATPEHIELVALQYSKHESILIQYWVYIKHLVNGDWGVSMHSQMPIAEEILNHLPATMELSLVALLIAMLIGIPIGFIAAAHHRKVADNIILSFAMIGYSIPIFWLGLLAILIFSIQLAWLPSAGQISLVYEIEQVTGFQFIDILLSDNPYKWQAFQNASAHIILPATVIAIAPATIFIRLARTAMLNVLDTHYIKAAMAKGLTRQQIIMRHAIRNSLVDVIRDVGLQFANLVTLAMVTEVIFSWPGIGRWLIESIYQRDYTAIQGGLLALSSFIFIVHILTDFIYASLNPLAREAKYGS
ncbi:antimicrobial peptide ABC transporter permease SapB [Thalassotalea insulae]|uniref:Antimicrobial peptide ABC transporter permease SapB n=1 Tax=Thalassotalea insulae TaxID=2056778 RepID=A0ABQ6GN29_9GAMM|nr:ABC transporter permease subunit [Thalassotalea insulae]GLX77400.1 antimicrobial peptide ABC transporter permease SapB [Thalassotalea insulae]